MPTTKPEPYSNAEQRALANFAGTIFKKLWLIRKSGAGAVIGMWPGSEYSAARFFRPSSFNRNTNASVETKSS